MTHVLFSTTQIRIFHDVLFLVNEMVPRVLNLLLNRHGCVEGANIECSFPCFSGVYVGPPHIGLCLPSLSNMEEGKD